MKFKRFCSIILLFCFSFFAFSFNKVKTIADVHFTDIQVGTTNIYSFMESGEHGVFRFFNSEKQVLHVSLTATSQFITPTYNSGSIIVRDSNFNIVKKLNTVNYKMGDGTKFNPYIVSE